MLKPKKRISKQDLKEDKLVKTTLQVKSYIDENYRQVVTVVLAIFAVIVIFIVYGQLKSQTSAEAQAELGIAQVEYTNNNLDNASERLIRLIEEYGSTDEAKQGMLILANIYYQQKKYEEAELYFREFVDSYSGSEILLASGYSGLAACMEIKSDYASAADYYETAANTSEDYTESDNFLYLSGVCFIKAGDNEKAKEVFKRIVETSKTNQRVRDAEAQLVILGEPIKAK
jgi:outer membrane protein assembly factor BamD (BamD/ComL family)